MWSRRVARQALGRHLFSSDTDATQKRLRAELSRARPPTGVKLNLPSKLAGDWDIAMESPGEPSSDFTISTVHGAKGHEYDGVLVVLAPDGRNRPTGDLLDAWENRDPDDEARSVLFVGMTRARLQLAIAAPREYSERVEKLMKRNGAAVEIRQVAADTRSGAKDTGSQDTT